jgi:hypothetical protein
MDISGVKMGWVSGEVSLAYDEAAFKHVEHWLVSALPGTVPSHRALDRDMVLFRAHEPLPGSPRYELEMSREALEDHKVETIVADLVRQKVADRLRADPTMRLNYNRDRQVPHLETLWVTCDSSHYRVVRDGEHNVRIYDKAGQLLANWPAAMTVIQTSIHRRPINQWCQDIQKWRGPNQ